MQLFADHKPDQHSHAILQSLMTVPPTGVASDFVVQFHYAHYTSDIALANLWDIITYAWEYKKTSLHTLHTTEILHITHFKWCGKSKHMQHTSVSSINFLLSWISESFPTKWQLLFLESSAGISIHIPESSPITSANLWLKIILKTVDLLSQASICKSWICFHFCRLPLLHEGDNQVPSLWYVAFTHREWNCTVPIDHLTTLKVTTGTYFDPALWSGSCWETSPLAKYLWSKSRDVKSWTRTETSKF